MIGTLCWAVLVIELAIRLAKQIAIRNSYNRRVGILPLKVKNKCVSAWSKSYTRQGCTEWRITNATLMGHWNADRRLYVSHMWPRAQVLCEENLYSSLLRCACTYLRSSDNLRFYLPSRAFASIRKITPQAIPRLYNGICVCIVVNDRICVMAVRLTGANRVILQKVYDYAGSKT